MKTDVREYNENTTSVDQVTTEQNNGDIPEDITEDITKDITEDITDKDNELLINVTPESRKQHYFSIKSRRHVKLLISRGALFIVGMIGCIVFGIASQYHPPDSVINGNYSQCYYFNVTEEFYNYTYQSVI